MAACIAESSILPRSQEESPPLGIANSVHNLTTTPKSSRASVGIRLQACKLQGRVLFKREEIPESLPKRTNKEMPNWTTGEFQALVSFLLLHTDGSSWSACKDPKFWEKAGEFVQQQTKSFHCRSGIKMHYAFTQYNV